MTTNRPLQLFRDAHWMLFGLAICLFVSFWIAGQKFGKRTEDAFQDPHRLAALKSFEQAVQFEDGTRPDAQLEAMTLTPAFPCASADELERLSGRLLRIESKLDKLAANSGRKLGLNFAGWPLAGTDCREVLNAAKWLADDNASRLDLMEWPGLRKLNAATVMRVPETIFRQDNPWRGADGCIFLSPTHDGRLLYLAEQRRQARTCPEMVPAEFKRNVDGFNLSGKNWPLESPAWSLPEGLGPAFGSLDRIRRPEGALYNQYTQTADDDQPPGSLPLRHGPNRLSLDGRDVDVGFNVFLTINPSTQRLVQQWVRCYVGDRHACDLIGLSSRDRDRLFGNMFEAAAMRMAAVALVDVASGRIEALGSAHTPCYAEDHSRPGHSDGCPDVPYQPRYDPDGLLNHALFLDAQPASTVKPILALAFLSDSAVFRSGEPLRDLQHDLKTSNSADFLDRLMCRPSSATAPWSWRECHRPQAAQAAAGLLGWNLECKADNFSADCAELDILFGRPAGRRLVEGTYRQPLGYPTRYGQLFVEPYRRTSTDSTSAMDDWSLPAPLDDPLGARLIQDFRFDEGFVRECSTGKLCKDCPNQAGRWRRCKGLGGHLVNEGWGQGEARSTPLGVAGMIARLAAAANGAKQQALPHLVDHIGDSAGKPFSVSVERLAEPTPITVEPPLAKLVLEGMTSHTKGGTADDACQNVFGAQNCEKMDWLAGKTGTPPFRFDLATLQGGVKKACPPSAVGSRRTACNVIPYKWYVAAFKSGAGDYSKAIAVLSERNWNKKDGRVQAPGDHGANLSAELAFRIIKSLRNDASAAVDTRHTSK